MNFIVIGMAAVLGLAGERQPMRSTPIDENELFAVIRESYHNVHGERATDTEVAGAWAHISLENGKGKRIWNNNLGNIGNLPSEKKHDWYSHYGKARYRSFRTHVAGGEAYWLFMRRCRMALKNFRQGAPGEAALSLKRCNYYRSDESAYTKTLVTLYGTALAKIKASRSPR